MEESLYYKELHEALLIRSLKRLIKEQPTTWKWRETIEDTINLLEGN